MDALQYMSIMTASLLLGDQVIQLAGSCGFRRRRLTEYSRPVIRATAQEQVFANARP